MTTYIGVFIIFYYISGLLYKDKYPPLRGFRCIDITCRVCYNKTIRDDHPLQRRVYYIMENYLCLIRQDEHVDWFLLCVKETMFCIACGPLDNVLKSLRAIKRKYRTTHGLREALNSMSEPARPNPLTYQNYAALYEFQQGRYDHYVEEVMEEMYDEVREKRKPKKPMLMKSKEKVQEKKRPVMLPTKKKPSTVKKVMKPMKSRRVEFEPV